MADFKELNNNMSLILQKLISNQDLCKLLYYNTDCPLDEKNIENTSELLFTKIYPFPRNTEIIETASSILMVGFDSFESTGANNFINSKLDIKILCHEELWNTKHGLRPYLIMHEISDMFNNQKIIGIGKLIFDTGNVIWDGKRYNGFALYYSITEFS